MVAADARVTEEDAEECKYRSEGRLPRHRMARRIPSLHIEGWQILDWELSSSLVGARLKSTSALDILRLHTSPCT